MATCRQCGLAVIWQKVRSAITCTNPDGSDHWDRCSAARWQATVANGERFTAKRGTETVIGYRHEGKERLEQISGKAVVGKHYRPLTCGCAHLPWEVNPDCSQQRAWLERTTT